MARAQVVPPPHRLGFLATLRTDAWWIEPAVTAVSLLIFFGWLGVSVFLDRWDFEAGPYISPVFEPKLFSANDSIFISPALVVLLGPIPFRATCYYYRRAYYRSWFMSPPACAVGDAVRTYKGETAIPFWFNNLHRFAMYGALVFVPILWWGAIRSFYHDGEIGIGLGSLILVVNAHLLMMYTFSCHSLRHLVGGGVGRRRMVRIAVHASVGRFRLSRRPPPFELLDVRVDNLASAEAVTADRQSEFPLPALHGAHASPEVGRDVLPPVQLSVGRAVGRRLIGGHAGRQEHSDRLGLTQGAGGRARRYRWWPRGRDSPAHSRRRESRPWHDMVRHVARGTPCRIVSLEAPRRRG